MKLCDLLSDSHNILAALFPTLYHVLSINEFSSVLGCFTISNGLCDLSTRQCSGSLLDSGLVDLVKELWQTTSKTDHELWFLNNGKYCKINRVF